MMQAQMNFTAGSPHVDSVQFFESDFGNFYSIVFRDEDWNTGTIILTPGLMEELGNQIYLKLLEVHSQNVGVTNE